MSEPKKNVYGTRTMVNNWVEERATREQVIKTYLELQAKGDIRAAELEADYNNIMKPAPLARNKIVQSGDSLLVVIHAPDFPLCVSTDARFPHFDFRAGRVCSLSNEISTARRHVFKLVKIADFGCSKMGRKLNTTNAFEKPELHQGDKFYLVVDREMIEFATERPQTEDWVLGCPKVVGSPRLPVVIAPVSVLGKDAEWTVEDFQMTYRLQKQGERVEYGYPLLLKHCISGQALGCGQEGPARMNIDLKSQEFTAVCQTVRDEHRMETQAVCVTFECDAE